MVGKLGHQEGLPDLRRSRKDIGSGVEQAIDDRRSALVGGLVQLRHGDGIQVVGVGLAAHPPCLFLQIFLKWVDFRFVFGYTVLG